MLETLPEFNASLDKIAMYIAQRDHSELELKTKLSRKFDQKTIEKSLAKAKSLGWLKTPQELSQKVAARLDEKYKGHLAIANYLRRKGLPIRPLSEQQEIEKCRELLDIKFANWPSFSYEEKQRVARFLKNRGFLDTTIMKVFYEDK